MLKVLLKSIAADCLRPTRFQAFVLISFLCLIVYFPSLFHVARGDQMNYIAEVAVRSDQSWGRLALGDFNFNRMRHFAPGDEPLFRPGLYFMLGTEEFLFGYDFKLWQATALFCHLLVLWWLLKLAWFIRPGLWTAGCVAVFSVMAGHMEMVIWHHISAYMIFLALILAGFYHLLAYERGAGSKHAGFLVLVLGTSVLFYEAALAIMFFVAAYLLLSRLERKDCYRLIIAFSVISVGYLVWSAVNFPANGAKPELGLAYVQNVWSWQTLQYALTALGWWFYSGLLPFKAELHTFSRMIAGGIHKPWLLTCAMLATGLVAVMAGAVWSLHRRKTGLFVKHGKLMLLTAAIMASLAGIIAVGRMNTQGPLQALSVATYYGYFFWAFMVVLAVAFVDDVIDATGAWRMWRWVAGVVLIILLGMNALLTFRKNVEYADGSRELIALTHQMQGFITLHQQEPDFSFYVPTHWPNYEISWLVNANDPAIKYSFVEIMFPKYFRRDHAKYRFL
ncbi:MAG: hypothetical protein HQL17_03515 [Candidatus Omnitrophica bacterium]|nr:hypothetical protein [Candidatus Omnitrophota bacterium]